jgi:uncharacterized membrane protein YccF (DUF307 family)
LTELGPWATARGRAGLHPTALEFLAERHPGAGGAGGAAVIGDVFWIILFGWWLALGHLVSGVLLCLTMVGIPLGIGSFKIIPVTLLPLGSASCRLTVRIRSRLELGRCAPRARPAPGATKGVSA